MAKASPSTKSKGKPRSEGNFPKEKPFADKKPVRSQRGDTFEAKTQAARAPKSHPGKASAPRNATRRHKAKGS